MFSFNEIIKGPKELKSHRSVSQKGFHDDGKRSDFLGDRAIVVIAEIEYVIDRKTEERRDDSRPRRARLLLNRGRFCVRFHPPACRNAITKNCRQDFLSRATSTLCLLRTKSSRRPRSSNAYQSIRRANHDRMTQSAVGGIRYGCYSVAQWSR